jgi:hypothetical protein
MKKRYDIVSDDEVIWSEFGFNAIVPEVEQVACAVTALERELDVPSMWTDGDKHE